MPPQRHLRGHQTRSEAYCPQIAAAVTAHPTPRLLLLPGDLSGNWESQEGEWECSHFLIRNGSLGFNQAQQGCPTDSSPYRNTTERRYLILIGHRPAVSNRARSRTARCPSASGACARQANQCERSEGRAQSRAGRAGHAGPRWAMPHIASWGW